MFISYASAFLQFFGGARSSSKSKIYARISRHDNAHASFGIVCIPGTCSLAYIHYNSCHKFSLALCACNFFLYKDKFKKPKKTNV